MKKFLRFIGILILLYPGVSNGQVKLRRAESFFGFHFDFHATAIDTDLGKFFDAALLDTFLLRIKPDYIQVDSKGHPGYASYPTDIGYSAHSFIDDPMRIWRAETNKYNIALYVHYSGLMDAKAMHEHPEWGRKNANGSIDSSHAAYLGAYSDSLMIPQLEELIKNYSIDGAWIDGDCWATAPDYSPPVVDSFLKKSDLKEVPHTKHDIGYKDWLDYNRLMYKKYLKNYITKIHQYKPGFQIASNWAYSSKMPEKPEVDVDFLSGDIAGANCVYSAAFQARCLALQGRPWDLMSWGMAPVDFWKRIYSRKSLIQLKQEAAEVMAVGGGFEVYYQQNKDASFRTLDIGSLERLSRFCRDRQPFCQYSTTIPQIGVWYSLEGWKNRTDRVYGWSSDIGPLTSLLLDCQYSVDILMDHVISKEMSRYPVIMIPEWNAFNPGIRKQLLNYVKDGGNLILIGAKAVKSFENVLNVSFVGKSSQSELLIGDKDLGGIAGLKTQWQQVSPNYKTKVIGHLYSQVDYRYALNIPVATINKYGKGNIAAVYGDLSSPYQSQRDPVFNKLLEQIINQLLPGGQLLHVTGFNKVHVAYRKKGEHTFIHLINTGGDHANRSVLVYNNIPSTSSLQVSLALDKEPRRVILQPGNHRLKFSYNHHHLNISVPPVDVYSIVEIIPY